MNSDSAPEALNEAYDIVLSQNAQTPGGHERSADMPSSDPAVNCPVTAIDNFVIPTEGGYFFVPWSSVLQKVASMFS